MKSEKPPFERMDATSDPPKSQYDQKLLETREKCLPLLERLVGKFSEYKKICTALKEKRPPLEWLNKLEATCEKIQKKMTAQFFEKLDESERESRSNTITALEKANTEIVSDRNQVENGMKTPKRSRWDVKPADDIQKDENPITEKYIPKYDERGIKKIISVSENRHKTEKGLTVIDLTKNEDVEELLCRQKIPRSQLKDIKEDLDVEIIASTAGHNPLRRAKSQTQFVTLEEVNKSPFYKKFTSDNMILDSRAANLKYGTVFDLVKSNAQASETRHRKYSQRRCEGLSRRPAERKESWSHRRDYENNKYHVDSFDKKASLSCNKSHVTNLVNDKTYEHLQIAVKFFDRNKESNISINPRWSDDSSSKTKYGKSGNEFQGKMPFYKQNIAGNTRYYPEKSFTTQLSKDPVHPNLYPASSKSFPSNQSVANAQFNSVGFPQQACSFHCNCCKNTPYFSSMGASYQPTATCVVGNSNYAFFSGQYFPNQTVISPPNKSLPTPFPTYAVPPPLSTVALATSTPYSNANKPGYSVPVFCKEGGTSTNKTTPTLMSWNAINSHHTELTCRNVVEHTSRPKDPRTDIIKDRVTQSTSNITQRLSAMDSALTKIPCFSGISEERFSQSCTFLRPDNLYRDFKCHSDEFRNNPYESLKSFGLINNVPTGNVPSKIDLINKSTISDSKNFSNNEVTCKINHSESNSCNENTHNLQSVCQTAKQEETINIQDNKTQKPQEHYISPLSNLYSDSNPKFEGYTYVTNKQLENRKRKYNEFLGGNFINSDNKRKNVGKDKIMSKLYHVENKECPTPKRKPNSEYTSRLKNHEINECSTLENSPRSDDTNLSTENWEKIKSPTEWVEKDCQPQSFQSSTKERISKTNGSPLTELLPSDSILVPQKENSFVKEKLLGTGDTFKNLKEQKPKLHDSTNNQSKPSKNTQVLEKQKPVGKDRQNNISSKKSDTKKIEPNYSHNDQLQSHEKTAVSQKEKIDCKANVIEKISSSKNIDKNPEPNTNSIVQLLPSENSPVSQKGKSVDKEKLPEKNITFNRSVNDKKKCTSTQTNQRDKSTEKETCLGKNGSSNKPFVIKNQDSHKMSTPLREKTSSTEKCILVINKNKDNYKTSIPQKGIDKKDHDKSSEKPTSIISKNKDNSKTSVPQKDKTSTDKDKSSLKPKYSKKPTKINNKSSQDKVITQQEDSEMQENCLKNNSMLQKIDTNINTDSKSLSQGKTSTPKERCPERKKPSRKRNIDKIKECSVVLKREKSVVIEKCADGNTYIEKTAPKYFIGNLSSPDKIQSHDMETFAEKKTDSQMQVTSNPEHTDKTVISQREKTLEKEKHSCEEISNYDNDKVKDLVLRMKSLSQSEALKVITEFASTLKVGESQQDIHVSKDQRVPSREEEMEQTSGQIKIKDEIIDDYPEPLKIENNIFNKINDNSKTADNVDKPAVYNTIKNSTVTSKSAKQQSLETCKIKENKIKLTLQVSGTNVKNAITDMKNCHASLNTVTEIPSEKLSTKVMAATIIHKEQTEKCKFNKKKKLSELEKIHADLESCHGLDDIMKCSGLRTCRLKNELGGTLKESTTEDKQIKKRRVTESPEQSFFIEDEITIKMEPIPEMTFDFIKQEPDYFE